MPAAAARSGDEFVRELIYPVTDSEAVHVTWDVTDSSACAAPPGRSHCDGPLPRDGDLGHRRWRRGHGRDLDRVRLPGVLGAIARAGVPRGAHRGHPPAVLATVQTCRNARGAADGSESGCEGSAFAAALSVGDTHIPPRASVGVVTPTVAEQDVSSRFTAQRVPPLVAAKHVRTPTCGELVMAPATEQHIGQEATPQLVAAGVP